MSVYPHYGYTYMDNVILFILDRGANRRPLAGLICSQRIQQARMCDGCKHAFNEYCGETCIKERVAQECSFVRKTLPSNEPIDDSSEMSPVARKSGSSSAFASFPVLRAALARGRCESTFSSHDNSRY